MASSTGQGTRGAASRGPRPHTCAVVQPTVSAGGVEYAIPKFGSVSSRDNHCYGQACRVYMNRIAGQAAASLYVTLMRACPFTMSPWQLARTVNATSSRSDRPPTASLPAVRSRALASRVLHSSLVTITRHLVVTSEDPQALHRVTAVPHHPCQTHRSPSSYTAREPYGGTVASCHQSRHTVCPI